MPGLQTDGRLRSVASRAANGLAGTANEGGVIRFVKQAAFPAGDMKHVKTRCAHVFPGGDLALKIRRAARQDPVD